MVGQSSSALLLFKEPLWCAAWSMSTSQQSLLIELQLDSMSIRIDPDIPLYDLQETMEAVGVPLVPEMPLLRALEVRC